MDTNKVGIEPDFIEEPIKGLAAAVLKTALTTYQKNGNLKQFVKWLKSEDCLFYETILGWSSQTFYHKIKKAGLLEQERSM